MSNITPVTRFFAKTILSTMKKVSNSKGLTLKKIHEYIMDEYPNKPNDIVKLNNTLQRALAFGVVSKINGRYVLSDTMKNVMGKKALIKTGRVRKRKTNSKGSKGPRKLNKSSN